MLDSPSKVHALVFLKIGFVRFLFLHVAFQMVVVLAQKDRSCVIVMSHSDES